MLSAILTLLGIQSVLALSILSPPLLEWDQTPTTFYTGQLLNVTWTPQEFQPNQLLKITYMGASLRTLTTGINSSVQFFSTRLSDSVNSVTTNASPVIVSVATNVAINASSVPINIIQSKIQTITVYDNTTLLGTGVSTVADNRFLNISWRSLGQSQIGTATVSIRSSGGGGTTVGTPVTVQASGNTSVQYQLPSSFTPGFGGTTYSAQITVQGPGSPYTGTSSSFSIVTPIPSPTSSVTPTKSQTSSVSPTQSQTPTPSSTISITSTPSETPTPRTILSAPEAINPSSMMGTVIGASIGSVVFVIASLGLLYYIHSRRELALRRARRARSARAVIENQTTMYTVYGVSSPQLKQYASNRSKV